jgi:cation transport ATPase
VVASGAPLLLPAGLAAVLQLACLAGLLVLLALVAGSARAPGDRLALLVAGLATFATAAGGAPALAAGAPGAAHLPLAFGAAVTAIALVARAVEARLASRSTAEIQQLLEALPRSALVSRAEGETETDLERVRAGEEIVVPAGEVVPVDGAVRAGGATVAPLQARASTVEIGPGQLVIAGARVMRGELRLVATFVGAERTLARVARLGLGQDMRPATLVRTATRAGIVSSCVGFAGAIAIASLSLGGGRPPAVGLATAAAFLLAMWGRPLARSGAAPLAAGAGRAARAGAFFRDAAALEAAAHVGTVVLPGSGTLTAGAPRVTDLVSVGERGEDELLALAAATFLAAAPDEAITAGLRAAATERGLGLPEVRRPAHRPGRGVLGAAPGGEDLVVGTRALLLAEGVSIAAADEAVSRLEVRGRTTVLVAVGGKVQGIVGLHDAVRPGARAAIDALHRLGVEPVLLTGDARTTAEALAHELGIDHLRAEVEPDERAAEVRRLTESGTTVAVIGHPLRDGAALDAADVALALESAGAPQGEPAVRLAGDALEDAVAALEEAGRAIAAVRRNVTIASGALVLGGILAGGGLLPPPAAALLAAVASALVARAPREAR